jgi:hypothetical protein
MQSIDFKGELIQIDLGDIDHLELKQTNNNKVIISTNQLEQEATFLNITQHNEKLCIKSQDTIINKPEMPACITQPLYTSYGIRIPKGIMVKISINSGNFKVNNFKGNMELAVNNGEIELDNCLGNILIKNIDGIITCTTNVQHIEAKSHLGKVFFKKGIAKNIKKDVNNMLIIESIRGNIFINTKKIL